MRSIRAEDMTDRNPGQRPGSREHRPTDSVAPVGRGAVDVGRAAASTGWVDEMIGLTVRPDGDWPTDQLVAAQMRVARLAVLARAVAASDDPELRTAFESMRGGRRALALARHLADELPLAVDPRRPRVGLSAADLAATYADVVRHAAGAVYYCRRVQHATGACWFSVHGADHDVCGEVLAVSHCLGEACSEE